MRDIVRTAGGLVLLGLLVGVGTNPVAGQDGGAQECQLQGTEILTQAEQLLNEAAELDTVQSQKSEADSKYEQAWKRVQLALRQDTTAAATYFIAGRTQLGRGNYAAADSMLEIFLQKKPGCEQIASDVRFQGWADAYNRGIRTYQAGQDSAALEYFRNANLLRDDARSLNNAAILQQKMGNLEQAEELYRSALEIAEDTSQVRTASINLAELLRNQGDADETLEIYRRYLDMNPGDVQARINYAVGLRDADMSDSAAAVLNAVMGRDDLSGRQWSDVGYSLLQMKAYSEAKTAFERAREEDPFDKGTMERLMTVNLGTQNFDRATTIGDTLLDWYPYEKDLFRAQMQALDRAGRTQAVQQLLPQLQNMPVIINRVTMQKQGENRYVISGQVQPGSAADRTVTIPFELMNAQGETIATKEAEVTVPGQNQSSVFQVAFQTDASVAGFRYRTIQ